MYVLLYHPQNGPMDGGVVYLDGELGSISKRTHSSQLLQANTEQPSSIFGLHLS